MKLYTNNDTYKIYQGSMLDLLEVIEPNTIDSVVTDPPYELNFMNKGWDRSGIAFQKETWEKPFQALKPGGYLLAFGGSRTFHRIAVAIEDAGFEIRDVIMWVYAQGFPKSLDISKALDKSMGSNGIDSGIKDKSYRNPQNQKSSIYKVLKTNETIILPETEIAKQWQGWGTALKPAYEPIIVARKPLKGTVAQNVMQYGVGGINIDECRVELDGEKPPKGSGNADNSKTEQVWGFVGNGGNETNPLGRFPANFIHDGSDEVVELFPSETGGGVKKSGSVRKANLDNLYGLGFAKKDFTSNAPDNYGDSGSASRFFYTAKASKKDRDEGLEISAYTINDGRKKSIDNPYQRGETPRKNIHPTVKPCELMQYLVRMVTPKGGTVMDCFMGSGSTGKAVMFENRERQANYKFIGIDLDLDNQYCEIANARIDYALNKFEYDEQEIREQDKEKGQLSIFDLM